MKLGTYGEIVLRLEVEDNQLLSQTSSLSMLFTGTGLNIMAGLSRFGLESSILSFLPQNNVGNAGVKQVESLGLDVRFIQKRSDNMAIYFLEKGYGVRPSEVTYFDRRNSSFNTTVLSDELIENYLSTIDGLFICGISILTSTISRDNTIKLLEKAKVLGKSIFFDFNIRASLLKEANHLEKVRGYYKDACKNVTIVFGSVRDLKEVLGLEGGDDDEVINKFLMEYNVKCFATTTKTFENQHVTIQGKIYKENKIYQSKNLTTQYLDTIGTGDAFAAGVIYGYVKDFAPEYVVNFATYNALLSYTINGDCYNVDKNMVEQMMKGINIAVKR
ncbi:MAG: sugar kinase [Bacteroidales bacterium]|nr:sugar kinase [Bacteroidales bacterium]